mgnify:FL=1
MKPEKLQATLSANMKAAREHLGITQKAAASSVKMSLGSWNKYEKCVKSPNLWTLAAIAKALKVKPHDLLNPAFRPGGPVAAPNRPLE